MKKIILLFIAILILLLMMYLGFVKFFPNLVSRYKLRTYLNKQFTVKGKVLNIKGAYIEVPGSNVIYRLCDGFDIDFKESLGKTVTVTGVVRRVTFPPCKENNPIFSQMECGEGSYLCISIANINN